MDASRSGTYGEIRRRLDGVPRLLLWKIQHATEAELSRKNLPWVREKDSKMPPTLVSDLVGNAEKLREEMEVFAAVS